MEILAAKCGEGRGRALIRRIIGVVRTARLLGLPFSEAFEKQPIELLQLLSLKAQDSFDEAKFLVETHIMPASSIARILADSFLKVCSLLRFLQYTWVCDIAVLLLLHDMLSILDRGFWPHIVEAIWIPKRKRVLHLYCGDQVTS